MLDRYGNEIKDRIYNLKDYDRKMVIDKNFSSLDAFILKWSESEKKEALLRELAEQGILLEALKEEVGKEMDHL